jgi:hypothetical protein
MSLIVHGNFKLFLSKIWHLQFLINIESPYVLASESLPLFIVKVTFKSQILKFIFCSRQSHGNQNRRKR